MEPVSELSVLYHNLMTESKKIAVLCNYQLLPDRVGGMDYFFWQFDKQCAANGIQVDWFFPNQSDHGEYNTLTVFGSEDKAVENYFLSFCKTNKTEYTHIITHFIELCTPFFYKIKQYSTGKIIAIDHNPRPIYHYSLKKRIEKRIKGILFSRYIDLFVGVSNYTVNEIINDFGPHLVKKSKTIYNGVILEDIQVRNHRNIVKPNFLVASHLRESKGIQDLITAVALLPSSIQKTIKIDLYGDGPYKSVLVEKMKQHDVEHCFAFMGSSPNLKAVFLNYDYMLQPTHMECFSLSILESLAANVPVITTNVGGNEEVLVDGENGYIFKAKDIHELKEILEKVYLGHATIQSNTRVIVENGFSLQKMVEQHFALVLDNKS
ncbi:Glycosyltransferase involved in cell wall bisynthesis [Flavobacterium xinjiangense]|uniref:Glycosyltransferase involved in cell wall bisynthesis n=2 Tax=Flavobacterium xinjiangense TaxID=178356 RepID=A0A1M7MWT0_9FLAO|nr:Glycosyltransferase involved in cell wall bisynthesis [Flavobacterium xinjiangense]